MLLVALLDQIETLLANIAYTAKAKLLVRLEEHQMEAVILLKSNQKQPWEFDRDKYRWRQLIANFIAKPKQYWGITTLYDQRVCAWVVASVIWLD